MNNITLKAAIFRLLWFAPMVVIIFIGSLIGFFIYVFYYVLYGGELIIYKDKHRRKNTEDIYKILEKEFKPIEPTTENPETKNQTFSERLKAAATKAQSK